MSIVTSHLLHVSWKRDICFVFCRVHFALAVPRYPRIKITVKEIWETVPYVKGKGRGYL